MAQLKINEADVQVGMARAHLKSRDIHYESEDEVPTLGGCQSLSDSGELDLDSDSDPEAGMPPQKSYAHRLTYKCLSAQAYFEMGRSESVLHCLSESALRQLDGSQIDLTK